MAESLYTGVTIQGLYSDQTGDQLFGITGTAVPASALYIAGKDTATGFLTPLSFTGGALNVNASITPPSDTTATGILTNPGDSVVIATSGTSALMLQITGAAITAGAIDFQVSLDGTTWQSANMYPVFPDGTPSASSTATSPSNWTLFVGGVQKFRVLADGTYAGEPFTIWLTAGQGQYSVETVSPIAANFLATVSQGTAANLNATVVQGTSPWVVSGTVTANQGTSPWVTSVSGTVAVTQSTSPWVVSGTVTANAGTGNFNVVGTKTNNAGAPNGTNIGALVALANAAPPTDTEGNLVLLSVDLAGNLRTTTTIGGTVATNLTQVAGVTLGATAVTAFGTAPAAANVPGANVSIFQGTAAIAVANPLFTEISDGTSAMGTMANFGTSPGAVKALNVNSSIFSGTTALTNTGGALNVNVSNASVTVAGNLTNNNAAPAANNVGVLPALIDSGTFPAVTLPAYTAGDQASPSRRVVLSASSRLTNTTLHPSATSAWTLARP